METYKREYDIATGDIESIRYQAREEIAMKKMLDEQGCSRTARIIRLVWAEGLHNPKLVAPFYHGLVAPILELHRENLRLAAHEHPHPALQRFPQLLVSPIMQGLLWQGMFKDKAPLDVKELYIAYLDIILPEK